MEKSHVYVVVYVYCRDDSDSVPENITSTVSTRVMVDGAPAIEGSIVEATMSNSMALLPMGNARQVSYNLPKGIMHAPVVGPVDPRDSSGQGRNHWAGQADDAHVSSFAFDDQYHGYHGASAGGKNDGSKIKQKSSTKSSSKKRKTAERPLTGIALDRPFVLKSRQPWADGQGYASPMEGDDTVAKEHEDGAHQEKHHGVAETTMFHGADGEDYQGRSWIDIPPGVRTEPEGGCFLPKRVIHTWAGHSKGVNTIRFYPGSGHLLLSGGMDGKAKVWSVNGSSRQCMRTYLGHSKGIRDVWFTDGGTKFLTSSYDKSIKLWDTETGSVLQKFGEGQSMAYSVRTNPDPSQPDVLLAGMQNKKILQFDMRTGDNVQEYNYHMDAVNTLTFVDGGRKFLSTSDDKTIRVWEFGVPVQTQCIKDPSMHAISAASLSHDGKSWIGQSANNQIVTYSIGSKVRQNRKKSFQGHACAGYACQVGMSHDDQFVYSGDGDGKLFIWSWKSKKIVRSLQAHQGVCISAAWHPVETSKVATCGWDGVIKLWD